MKQPVLQPLPDKELYRLVEDYEIDVHNVDVVVPAGFIYDGASIPAYAWQAMYTPFHPKVMAPALVHDWLYSIHKVSRDSADEILSTMLEMNGVSTVKAFAVFQAVQMAGEPHWQNNRDDHARLVALCAAVMQAKNFSRYGFSTEIVAGAQQANDKRVA